MKWDSGFFPSEIATVIINGNDFMFKIQKNEMDPCSWHRFCFNLDEKSYQVIVDGHTWYQANYTNKSPNKSSVNELMFGSNYPEQHLFSDYKDFNGEISELNIWGKSLSTNDILNITKNCGNPEPIPDLLNWFDVKNSMVEGDIKDVDVKHLCHNSNASIPMYKTMPILLDQKGAMHMCKIMQAQLAYPKTLEGYKKWQSMCISILKCKKILIPHFLVK